MTKNEYIAALKQELQALPYEEQKEALDYYSNYFDDAGSENLQSTIAELGSPEKLGAYIRSNFTCVPAQTENTGKQGGRAKNKNASGTKTREQDQSRSSGTINSLLVVLLAITFPVWLPILVAILASIFALLVAGLAVGFAGIAAALGIGFASIIVYRVSLAILIATPLQGLLGIGVSLVVLGLALLVLIFGVWFCIKVIPTVIRVIVTICKLPFKNKQRTRT